MRQTYFPSTSPSGAGAYSEPATPQHQQAPRPLLPTPGQTSRAPSPTERQAARRGRDQFMQTMNTRPAVRNDELHASHSTPSPEPHLAFWQTPGAQRQQAGSSQASSSTSASGTAFTRSDSWNSQASHSTMASSISSTSTAQHSPSAARATQAIYFFTTNANTGTAYAPLHPEFLGHTRHLSMQTEQALERRLSELSSIEKQAHRHVAAADLNPDLAAELSARGWPESRIESMEAELSAQCEKQKKAIHTLQAHALVRVSDNPMCTWVAQQMMTSQQSRDGLRDYLKDTRPLELKIKRNQLDGMRAQLNAPPPRGASQQKVGQYNKLSMQAGLLQSEIMALEKVVDPSQIPDHEHSQVLSTEVSDRYLAKRYAPLRMALHDLRNQTDRAISLNKNNGKPETQALGAFRKQVDAMIGDMFRAENQHNAALIEQAFAGKTAPRMDYVPEAAASLINMIATHKQSTRLPSESRTVLDARSQLDAAQHRHHLAHQHYLQQQAVMRQTGAPINDQVANYARTTLAQLRQAQQIHGPLVAHADHERGLAKAFAERSAQRQKFCEEALFQMLDTKIGDTMMRGFASLSSAPHPKPVGEQIELIRKHYSDGLQQLSAQWQDNATRMQTLRQQIQQARQNGESTSTYGAQLHALDEAQRNNAGQAGHLNNKLDFLNRR